MNEDTDSLLIKAYTILLDNFYCRSFEDIKNKWESNTTIWVKYSNKKLRIFRLLDDNFSHIKVITIEKECRNRTDPMLINQLIKVNKPVQLLLTVSVFKITI